MGDELCMHGKRRPCTECRAYVEEIEPQLRELIRGDAKDKRIADLEAKLAKKETRLAEYEYSITSLEAELAEAEKQTNKVENACIDLAKQLAASEARAGEMRRTLEDINESLSRYVMAFDDGDITVGERVESALSSSAGRGWVSQEQWSKMSAAYDAAMREGASLKHKLASVPSITMCGLAEHAKLRAENAAKSKALADLLFECDGVICTRAPSRDTYNRAFDVSRSPSGASDFEQRIRADERERAATAIFKRAGELTANQRAEWHNAAIEECAKALTEVAWATTNAALSILRSLKRTGEGG